MQKFRGELLSQVAIMADASSILLGDANARTGLEAVVRGETDRLAAALANPENQAKYVKILAERGIATNEKNIFETVGSVLARLGIQFGLSIASLGALTFYVENKKLDEKKLLNKLSLENASLTQTVGKNGGSVSANLDLLGGRLEANWNDPEARMKVALFGTA